MTFKFDRFEGMSGVSLPGVYVDDFPARSGVFFRGLLKGWAFIKKDMKISVSYKLQFIFQFFQIFFSVALVYFIGRMVTESGVSRHLSRYGSDYFSFALVGLAVGAAVLLVLGAGSSGGNVETYKLEMISVGDEIIYARTNTGTGQVEMWRYRYDQVPYHKSGSVLVSPKY